MKVRYPLLAVSLLLFWIPFQAYGQSGSWRLTGGMIDADIGVGAVLLHDGRVLFIGERQRANIYDPTTENWNRPAAIFSGLPVLLADGRVLLTAHIYHGVTTWIYDPVTGTLNRTGDASTSRSGHTATLLADGRVLVAGGYDREYCLAGFGVCWDEQTNTAELYTP